MNSYAYVDQVNDNLLCCICRAPFIEPLKARTCSHTFCKECIFTALKISKHCPIDRCLLAVDDLSPADPLVRNLVDELIAECPRRDAGCEHTCQRQLIAAHLKETCEFAEVPCQDGKCDRIVSRKDALHEAHNGKRQRGGSASQPNADEKETCEDCNSEFLKSDLSTHRTSCQDAIIPCTQAANGCPWNGRRAQQAVHLATCQYEAIKGFFSVFTSQVTSLNTENTALRQKVSALEGVVSSLRYELSAIQRALGPWYRQDFGSAPLAPLSRFTTEMMSTTQQYTDSTHEGPAWQSTRNTHPDAPLNRSSAGSVTDLSDLASYFPPADDDGDPLTHVYTSDPSAASSHLGSPSQPYSTHNQTILPPPISIPSGSNTHYAPHSTSATSQSGQPSNSPPHIPPVAPLNISTTLEGTLHGLRESIVTLGAAVDSLARRQDIALSTEAMRTAEELRSLRVVIHGLRMQVHSIMMDRNMQVGERGDLAGALPWTGMPDVSMRHGEGLAMPWVSLPHGPRYPPPPPSSIPKL